MSVGFEDVRSQHRDYELVFCVKFGKLRRVANHLTSQRVRCTATVSNDVSVGHSSALHGTVNAVHTFQLRCIQLSLRKGPRTHICVFLKTVYLRNYMNVTDLHRLF